MASVFSTNSAREPPPLSVHIYGGGREINDGGDLQRGRAGIKWGITINMEAVMAQAYDYMNDIGPAGAGLGSGYLRLRAAALSFAGRLGFAKFAGIAAGAPDVAYTLAMLLRDGRVPRRAKIKLGLAAAYFALPIDGALGVVDDVYVGLVALAESLGDIDSAVLAEYWPGEVGELFRFKAALDGLNERFGAGAVRRFAKSLQARAQAK